jgi:hypothetical protein
VSEIDRDFISKEAKKKNHGSLLLMTKSTWLVGVLVNKRQFSAAITKEDCGIVFLHSVSETV